MPPLIRSFFFKLVFAEFGKDSFIDYGCYFRYPWKVKIGQNVTINRGCKFFPSLQFPDAYIQLGDNVVFGPDVVLYGAGHDPRSPLFADVASSIVIKSGVYVGGSSVLRYGVTIGKDSVVAAGSLVVKSVPSGVIVGGSPAKFICVRTLD
jgi:acetyltransferase-like isoleucine patch superfamily enzyme